MGGGMSRLFDLADLDLSEAVYPDREKVKLETNFVTPAKNYVKLADPRSISQNIDRTPILVPSLQNATPVSRPKYLETDLDEAIAEHDLSIETSSVELPSSIEKEESDESLAESAISSSNEESVVVDESDPSPITPVDITPLPNINNRIFAKKIINTRKGLAFATPQGDIRPKIGGRTPLGLVSDNTSANSSPVPLNQVSKWKRIDDERVRRGLISLDDPENTPPPLSNHHMYPPEVVQSAPGHLRSKTKWSHDNSLII